MRKFLLLLLIVLPVFLGTSFYFLDKQYFFCPIDYKGDIIVRNDSRGEGFFAAERSGMRLHEGIDLFAGVGTPVFASRLGIVAAAKSNRGMGNYVVLKHLGNLSTIYGHLSRIYVRKGVFVRQGQIIGAVGKTGNAHYRSIQPHLHFEVRKKGIPVDPLQYLQ